MATALAPHTLSSFEGALGASRNMAIEMGTAAVANVRSALSALQQLQAGQTDRFKQADDVIDVLERRIADSVIQTLTLHAPMADDLRELVAVLRISTQLERVGDQSKGIAKRTPESLPLPMVACVETIAEMGGTALSLLSDSLQSFRDHDLDAAYSICRQDEELNEAFERLSLNLVSLISSDPSATRAGTNLLSIAKCVERLGDYAVNIADEVVFMLSGEHRPD